MGALLLSLTTTPNSEVLLNVQIFEDIFIRRSFARQYEDGLVDDVYHSKVGLDLVLNFVTRWC